MSGVQAVTGREASSAELESLPLGQRLDNLGAHPGQSLTGKRHRPLDTVEVVVDAGAALTNSGRSRG